jgi:protein-disulfide isomerase
MSEYPGEVRFIEKDYPLNPECNPGVTRVVHTAACPAAVAVRLARDHKRGDEMEDWLYTNQPSLSPETVRQAAQTIGHITDFDDRYATTLQAVKADAALGQLLSVRVTPTFFINGVKMEGGLQPQYFDAAIAYELKKAGKLK